MSNIEVTEERPDRAYFSVIPNIVCELGLSPHALSLYVHLKRTCGDLGGKSWKNRETLARETNMSAGKVSAARAELEKHKLIKVARPSKRKSAIVTITDMWDRNMSHFASRHHMTTESSAYDAEEEPLEEEVTKANAFEGNPKNVGLEKYITDRMYEAYKAAGFPKWNDKEYGFHVQRAKVLINDIPDLSDEEIERLPKFFVDYYTDWNPKADAVSSLREMRRRAARENNAERREEPHKRKLTPEQAAAWKAEQAELMRDLLEDD